MPALNESHRAESSAVLTEGVKITVSREEARLQFQIVKQLIRDNQASVVFEVADSLGHAMILKVIPSSEYNGKALLDEMSEAAKLSPDLFAEVVAWGDLIVAGRYLKHAYKAIVVKKVNGEDWAAFVENHAFGVATFLVLAEQLCRALDTLQRRKLSHDDLHPGNIMVEVYRDDFADESKAYLKIIDTGTIKRIATRESLLASLDNEIQTLRKGNGDPAKIRKLEQRRRWKQLDDHLRVVEALTLAANSLVAAYPKLDLWERKFVDGLEELFRKCVDDEASRRLDDPKQMLRALNQLKSTALSDSSGGPAMIGPFDYISAEMIRDDKEFATLFSAECPWLSECEDLKPIYLYGPRGCGKSSVLRWLSFKTQARSLSATQLPGRRQVGIYVSCSVELRSKFWLFSKKYIDNNQAQIIKYFNLLLLEEFFDTLTMMFKLQREKQCDFSLQDSDAAEFSKIVEQRLGVPLSPRLQGLAHFEHLKYFVRKLKWETWSYIVSGDSRGESPDPSLVQDICRAVPKHFAWFRERTIVFLLDDYSMQRIPAHLQKKLNQTISFAKQSSPIFKVSSEYLGVDLSGITQGREVVEINVGERYMRDETKAGFLVDIIDRRLKATKYSGRIGKILGQSEYGGSIAKALAEETKSKPFYYHGIECVHLLCSGDVALAISLIRRLFETEGITKDTVKAIEANRQHNIIQQYAHEEVKRIRHLVPYGDTMYDIVCCLGYLSRAHMKAKKTIRSDKRGEPSCMTHIDIPTDVIVRLKKDDKRLYPLYESLVSKAVLVSLRDSRSGDRKTTERLQIKRIYLPAFKAAPKRDVPLKISTLDDLKSLLSNPKTFVQRHALKSKVSTPDLDEAIESAIVKPRSS